MLVWARSNTRRPTACLRLSVESAKAIVSTLGACAPTDSCTFLAAKIAAISAEIAARVALDTSCFRGGNTGHRQQVQDKINMVNRCYRFFQTSNCRRGTRSIMNLRSQLLDAFASRSHPGTNIVRPESEASSDRMRDVLKDKTVCDISVHDINTVFEGNLWMLTRNAFLHYLPAFMDIALTKYKDVSVFASELIGALTKPSRSDVLASLDRLEQLPASLGLSDPAVADPLRRHQLEWFDSGTPTAIFEARFHDLTAPEGAAILVFLEAFREKHGANFPFGELDAAIDRYWARFRGH